MKYLNISDVMISLYEYIFREYGFSEALLHKSNTADEIKSYCLWKTPFYVQSNILFK